MLSRFVYVGPWLTLWLVVTALCGSKAAITVLLIFVALSFVPPGDVSPPCLTLHVHDALSSQRYAHVLLV